MKKPVITHMLPSNLIARDNSHDANTHKEWCLAEVERMNAKGDNVFLHEEKRDDEGQITKWCRVERNIGG